MHRILPDTSLPTEEAVLGKAVTRTAERLGLRNRVLAKVIGVSEPTASRLKNGGYRLRRAGKAFELGVLLVRLYRSLDSITGGDDAVSRAWIQNENTVLNGRPLDKIQTVTGLVDVIAYLDARRALV